MKKDRYMQLRMRLGMQELIECLKDIHPQKKFRVRQFLKAEFVCEKSILHRVYEVVKEYEL